MDESTQKTMFSSDKQNWSTPQKFFDRLNKEFDFTLDPCADNTNHKCSKYYTEQDDGLSKSWTGEVVFVNPPYKQAKQWIKKCYEESLTGAVVVALIPSRTDVRFWHDYCMKAHQIRFVKGRLKFDDRKNTAPFPSAVIIWGLSGKPIDFDAPQITTMGNK